MAVVLALGSAASYGIADYLAGVVSRSWDSRLMTAVAQLIGLMTAIVAVLSFGGAGPSTSAILWGALSGVGSAVGVLALYEGLAVASMSVVAPICGVGTAVIPAVVGIALGDRLSAVELVGIVLTLPAVALVSREPGTSGRRAPAGALLGIVAGVGFGLLFVALDRAGTRHGAWPLLPGQVVSLVLIAPFATRALGRAASPSPRTAAVTILAGLLSGAANLLFLLATRHGELAIVGVLSSLYPAGTVLIARVRLAEVWSLAQRIGLLLALVAVVCVAS